MNKLFYTLSTVLLLFASTSSYAQKWQWAKTSIGKPISTITQYVQTLDINGNLYLAYTDSNINVDGHFRKGYASTNICIVSFDCSGKFRWAKMIENGVQDRLEMYADTLDGIYIKGLIKASDSAVSIDEDATISKTDKTLLIVKFDSSGKYKWHAMPEPNVVDKGYDFVDKGMCVANNGSIRILGLLEAGTFCEGKYTVTDTSLHIVGYDKDGNFETGFHLDITGSTSTMFYKVSSLAWDSRNDAFYFYGFNIKFGTRLLDSSLAIGKFDNTGHNIWVKESLVKSDESVTLPKLITDNNGGLYIGCYILPGGKDTVAYTFTNTFGKNVASPAIIKMDKDGAVKWIMNSSMTSGNMPFIFSYATNKIGITGFAKGYALSSEWGGKIIGRSFTQLVSPFIRDSTNNGTFFVSLDASSGTLLNADSILGSFVYPYAITGNKKGSFYIAGTFGLPIYGSQSIILSLPGFDTLHSKTITSFLVKYGVNDCYATSIPVSKIEYLKVYPNPVNDYFIVENAALNSTINVYNLLGQKIYTQSIDQDRQTVPASQFAPGMYMIEVIETDQYRSISKIIKQ